MKILLTGITGYIGSTLLPRLERDGHEIRGFSRSARKLESGVPMVRGDALTGAGLEEALDGVEVAYYLLHSMEPSANHAFDMHERVAAENFARAAVAGGVRRVVYLGGPAPAHGAPSRHLASRLAVEQILLSAVPASIAFRASIAIGARSRSFRFLVHLVERMPILPLPAWGRNRTSPIDERDLIELLARAATSEAAAGSSLDARGRELVTYAELIERIRDHMLVARATITFKRLNLTPITSRIATLIAGEDFELIGPLMESLEDDLIPRDNRAAELLGVKLHSLDCAIERALRQWELCEPLAAR
jgi:uncharacterized protein YbjT (DUF2867 family)